MCIPRTPSLLGPGVLLGMSQASFEIQSIEMELPIVSCELLRLVFRMTGVSINAHVKDGY